MRTLKTALCGVLFCAGLAARADEPAANPAAATELSDAVKLDIAQMVMQMAGAAESASAKSDSPFPDFKEVTKDMTASPGMFTLWAYPPGATDKDTEKLLAQVPAAMLGQRFMLSTSVSGGGYFTGFPLDERVVQWEIHDRQLVLVEPQTNFVINQSKEVADVIRRTYPERIRAAVPIVTKAPGGDPVIDLGALLKSEFADIGWMSMFGMGGINPSLSEWTKKKTFPGNVEIGVALAIGRFSPPGSYDKQMVHYSFWKLPDTGYRPRQADDRIGYFLTTNQDWSKPTAARDLFNRYINRWQLEKRDPALALCEPKQPIVYYIEKTVPVRFRRAVRDGILEWNKAYRQIGFLNAVEVRQQTDDNEWKDLDPEDMRYSFFRWIVTGAGFAMGPSRANPFTGQIYDADIIFDDSMVRFFEQEAGQMLPTAAMARKAADPTLAAFFEKYPQWRRPTADWLESPPDAQQVHEQQMRAALYARMQQRGCNHGGGCDYLEGMKHQMAVSRAILEGAPEEVIDQFLYEVIKEVVMHEVGHTLGLRHNFKASSVFSVAEIERRRTTGEATCGSVMDYNPVLFFANNPTGGRFTTPTLGPYDFWAIEYGYRPFDATYQSKRQPDAANATPVAATETAAAIDAGARDAGPAGTATAQAAVDLSQIPADVLAQLPDELKAMLAGGAVSVSAAGKTGGKTPAAPAVPIAGEEAMLADIANRSTEPLLAYATDEDATFLAPDPTVNRFDMASDPIDWAEARMVVVDQRMANILDWAVKDGESWYHLRDTYQRLMSEKLQLLDYVGRYIGGQYFHRAHRGQGETPPFVPVDPAKQRRALKFIADQLFTDAFFATTPDVLNHLAPSRWWHEGAGVSYTMDYPVRNMISVLQWWNLFDRLFPNTLRRIHDAELKTSAADKLTLAEYLRTLQQGCWADAVDSGRLAGGSWSDAAPFISDIRRSLQREYLSLMEPLVRYAPGTLLSPDIHAMLRESLRQLATDLAVVKDQAALDFASRAHLEACHGRIERMLSPELPEYGY